MATEAFVRLREHGWIARKFASFIEETYGPVEYAMETITPDSLSITFISNSTLVIVTTPVVNSAELNLESLEYPLKNVAKLSTQHEQFEFDPDDPLELEKVRVAFKVTLVSGEELAFDFKNVTNPVRVKTKDSRDLLRQIRNIIQSL